MKWVKILVNEQWWYVQCHWDGIYNEMKMIYIQWECDEAMTIVMIKDIFYKDTDGRWGEMKKKYMMSMYIKKFFKLLFSPPPVSYKKDS